MPKRTEKAKDGARLWKLEKLELVTEEEASKLDVATWLEEWSKIKNNEVISLRSEIWW